MFIYHICAQKENHYFSGIVPFEKKIISKDDYRDLKKWIAEKMDIEDFYSITILSLTFLHEIEIEEK